MRTYTNTNTNKALGSFKAQMLHAQLASSLGGVQADYYVEWGGDNPNLLAVTTSAANASQIGAVVDAFDSLTLATDKATIDADDTDTAAITCSDAAISGDANVDYAVYGADGSLDFSGTVAVTGGTATLSFKTAVADTYLIKFARQGADENGFVEVAAE